VSLTITRIGMIAVTVVLATTGFALAETTATPVPTTTVAQATPTPAPTPGNPLQIGNLQLGGYLRSYYFTRQNAANAPGVQFDFSPGAKYNSNAVNQASWNTGIDLKGQYNFENSGWFVGAGYFYANPMSGPCVVPANHTSSGAAASNVISCDHQTPPNTNADDTLPGFTMSTFDEAYVGYDDYGFNGKIGNMIFNSPWANPSDSRLKPNAFQGVDLAYTLNSNFTFEGADMIAFENRTSSAFTQQTLLTSYPAGAPGLPKNTSAPGGNGIVTSGFGYGKLGYTNTDLGVSADGYYYGVSDLMNIWWFDGKYQFMKNQYAPYVALQGGFENNAGQSYLGVINSQDFGIQLGANATKNIVVTVGFDSIPWKNQTINLPKGASCSTSAVSPGSEPSYQVGGFLNYFLPSNAAQCVVNPNGTATVYYGGWASPYTDSYATDPFFTTSISQGMADRRAPGTSEKIAATYTSTNKRWVFLASDAWYNYGNALAPENTNEWDLDGQYHFSNVPKSGPYRGLLLRYRYAQRSLSNTYYPDAASDLGGLPLFKYNRAQLEYDF
jgi:hypothetical protein